MNGSEITLAGLNTRTPSKKILLWSHWMLVFCAKSMRTCPGHRAIKTFAVWMGTKLFCILRTLELRTLDSKCNDVRHHKNKHVKKRCLNRNQTLTWGFLWQDLSDSSKLWRSQGAATRTIAPDLCLRSSWHRSGWRGFGVGTKTCICRKCWALANLFWALQDTARAWTTLLDFYCLFLKMYLLHTLLSWSLCRFLPSQAGVGRYISAQFGFWLTSFVEKRIGSCSVQACTLKGCHWCWPTAVQPCAAWKTVCRNFMITFGEWTSASLSCWFACEQNSLPKCSVCLIFRNSCSIHPMEVWLVGAKSQLEVSLCLVHVGLCEAPAVAIGEAFLGSPCFRRWRCSGDSLCHLVGKLLSAKLKGFKGVFNSLLCKGFL